LAGKPLDGECFKRFLGRYVQTLESLFPLIDDFLEGKLTKGDFLKRFLGLSSKPNKEEKTQKDPCQENAK
jgi:hypothetical protein